MNIKNVFFTERGQLKVVQASVCAFAVFLALIVVMAYWPLRSVPSGHRAIITIGGKTTAVHHEGFMLLFPWEQMHLMNMRANSVEVKGAQGATADRQPVTVSMVPRYAITPGQEVMVYERFSKDGDLDPYVATATQEAFKAATAGFTAPELVTRREEVSVDVKQRLGAKVAVFGAHIISNDMTDFAFNEKYMEAINRKVTEEELRQAAENKVLRVQAEQKEKVAVAEAEAEAARRTADGAAYAVMTAAKAQADALRIQNEALRQSQDVLELRKIEVEKVKAERWDGALPQSMYAGAPIPFMGVPVGR
jgi:regulator of protease activity HflC (stomatin/prohibitin superfamily)